VDTITSNTTRPAGILPFGLGAKIAFAPNTGTNANASSNDAGSVPTSEEGSSAEQYQINASPIEGLSLTGSYFVKNNPQSLRKYKYEAGGISAKYAVGPVTLGYGQFKVQPSILKLLWRSNLL
jgi:hypothetical protein